MDNSTYSRTSTSAISFNVVCSSKSLFGSSEDVDSFAFSQCDSSEVLETLSDMATPSRSGIGRTTAFPAQMPPYDDEDYVDDTNNTDPVSTLLLFFLAVFRSSRQSFVAYSSHSSGTCQYI